MEFLGDAFILLAFTVGLGTVIGVVMFLFDELKRKL